MTISDAKHYLQTIDPETVGLIKEYKDIVDNLEIYEFRGDQLYAVSVVAEIEALTSDYHIIALGEGYVNSISEFEQIYDALCLIEN